MNHLLVALDYAGCAVEVAEVASELASKLGATVTLLYVVSLPEGVGATVHLHGALEGSTASEALDTDARHALAYLSQAFVERGVHPRIVLRHGDVAKRILEAAAEQSADLIVTGTHGRSGISRMVLGSVAEKVIRHSAVPVLTVRTKADALAGLSATQHQLLVENDG